MNGPFDILAPVLYFCIPVVLGFVVCLFLAITRKL